MAPRFAEQLLRIDLIDIPLRLAVSAHEKSWTEPVTVFNKCDNVVMSMLLLDGVRNRDPSDDRPCFGDLARVARIEVGPRCDDMIINPIGVELVAWWMGLRHASGGSELPISASPYGLPLLLLLHAKPLRAVVVL